MQFKDKVHAMRKQARLSQQELGEAIGVSDRTIQNYEHGRSYPASVGTLKALADALGVTTDYLMAGEVIPKVPLDEKVSPNIQVQSLVHDLAALFAGGELDEEDKDAAMQAVTEAYFMSRKKHGGD